jgi:hypothetical protein
VAIWGYVEARYVPEGLHHFARSGLLGWAQRALAKGVPVDAPDDLGETPLLLAVLHGQREMVKLLILSGANPSIPDRLGQTPLDAARTKGHADIADILRRNSRATDSTSPDESSARRLHARRRVLADVVLAASVIVLLVFLFSDRREITPDDFARLIEAKQLKAILFHDQCLSGEVKDPDHPVVRSLGLAGGRFWTPISLGFLGNEGLRRLTDAGARYDRRDGGAGPEGRRPSLWVVVAMLAWPVGVLGLGLLPLLESRSLFPLLVLSGRRARAAPQA